MIPRVTDVENIRKLLAMFPVTAILGARQCGKTTISKEFKAGHYFDLENPRDMARPGTGAAAILENAQSLSWPGDKLFGDRSIFRYIRYNGKEIYRYS